MRNDTGLSALREDLHSALQRVRGPRGRRELWRALRELDLDGETALAIATRLKELWREMSPELEPRSEVLEPSCR